VQCKKPLNHPFWSARLFCGRMQEIWTDSQIFRFPIIHGIGDKIKSCCRIPSLYQPPISRADCCAMSARRCTTAHITVVSTVLCTGYVVNCLLCAYECDLGDNVIITIVKTGLTTKKNVIFLSV
jgi:hypothetical protein